jgi:hypothetical protein
MKRFSMRPAEPKDAKNYAEWLAAASKINLVDPQVYRYPAINTVVVEKEDEPVLMTSFHPVIMIEALAPKPGVSSSDEGRALYKLYEGLRNLAKASGVAEIWFTCNDPSLIQFIERKGFKLIKTPVYKMVIDGPADPCRPEEKAETVNS